MKLPAYRAAISDIFLPRKYTDLATHPEGTYHLASFEKEVYSQAGITLPPDIDIKHIPSDLIFQLISVYHMKYEGLGNHRKKHLRGSHFSDMTLMNKVKIFLAAAASTGRIFSKLGHATVFL